MKLFCFKTFMVYGNTEGNLEVPICRWTDKYMLTRNLASDRLAHAAIRVFTFTYIHSVPFAFCACMPVRVFS